MLRKDLNNMKIIEIGAEVPTPVKKKTKMKTIIIGKDSAPKTQKRIQLCVCLRDDYELQKSNCYTTDDYNYAELICRDYSDRNGADHLPVSYDLIFCYKNPEERSRGVLFLGYWNDGVA